ncbi:hypothetical protein QBC35DRAFT_532295 [Podospora australis]|uniref:Uncharacterized protein n=1 Tax=Podospora australis TaxID=1536484 RepID=A0AAN6WUG7_9PEZI|nr:hypothetical protein QBC35DRAFT_532295 [Podospora australis]
MQSPFFALLPREVREKVYKSLFHACTRFRYGGYHTQEVAFRTRPAKNLLTILESCKRVKEEIGGSCISNALFDLQHFEACRSKLTEWHFLMPGVCSKIRHVRIPNVIRLPHYFGPSLELDTLTLILDKNENRWKHSEFDRTFFAVENIVKDGSGWKELRIISPSSRILGPRGYKSLRYSLQKIAKDTNSSVKIHQSYLQIRDSSVSGNMSGHGEGYEEVECHPGRDTIKDAHREWMIVFTRHGKNREDFRSRDFTTRHTEKSARDYREELAQQKRSQIPLYHGNYNYAWEYTYGLGGEWLPEGVIQECQNFAKFHRTDYNWNTNWNGEWVDGSETLERRYELNKDGGEQEVYEWDRWDENQDETWDPTGIFEQVAHPISSIISYLFTFFHLLTTRILP